MSIISAYSACKSPTERSAKQGLYTLHSHKNMSITISRFQQMLYAKAITSTCKHGRRPNWIGPIAKCQFEDFEIDKEVSRSTQQRGKGWLAEAGLRTIKCASCAADSQIDPLDLFKRHSLAACGAFLVYFHRISEAAFAIDVPVHTADRRQSQ